MNLHDFRNEACNYLKEMCGVSCGGGGSGGGGCCYTSAVKILNYNFGITNSKHCVSKHAHI